MLPFRIALRYLLSRKSHGAVNVISAVSMAGVAVAAAAMIVILSVFNGFSRLVEQKTSNFNPPLLVVPEAGKTIADADALADLLKKIPGVETASPMIDEQGFAIAQGGQMPVNIRAMAPEAVTASGLAEILIDGELDPAQATVSVGVALGLNVRPWGEERQAVEGPVTGWLQVFEPARTGRVNPANPAGAFRGDSLRVAAVYQVEQEEQDRDMMIIPLATARRLLDYTSEATSVAVYPLQDVTTAVATDITELKQKIADTLPAGMTVLDRLGQEAEAYRMIAVEKWITFLMLLFILAVSSFNIISTLSLMIVEKEKNMAVFSAMGASPHLIQRIFANQGWLITTAGGCIGLLAGSLLTLGQQHFGWVRLHSANPALMAVDSYPVRLDMTDLVTVFLSILLTSILIAVIGALLARPRHRAG